MEQNLACSFQAVCGLSRNYGRKQKLLPTKCCLFSRTTTFGINPDPCRMSQKSPPGSGSGSFKILPFTIKVLLGHHRCTGFINNALGFKYSPSGNRLRPRKCQAPHAVSGYGKDVCSPRQLWASTQALPGEGQEPVLGAHGQLVGEEL